VSVFPTAYEGEIGVLDRSSVYGDRCDRYERIKTRRDLACRPRQLRTRIQGWLFAGELTENIRSLSLGTNRIGDIRIVLQSIDPANDLAARLGKQFMLPLPHAREWAAKLLGYPLWQALLGESDQSLRRMNLSAPDSQCAPLAVRWRRTYQAQRLAELSAIVLSDAARLIDEIRPSDGFEFQSPFEGQVPRLLDPLLSMDDHRSLAAALATLRGIASRESSIDRTLRTILISLEALLITEYPIEQYPYETREPYRRRSMLDLPKRTPKFLSAQKHQECVDELDAIRTALARDWSVDLMKPVADMLAKLERVKNQIDRWRRTSAAHDSDKVSWRGVAPEEEEVLDALAAAVLPEHVSLLKTSAGFAVLSDEEAGLMLAHLRAQRADGTEQRALRRGIRRLQAIVRRGEQDERQRWERKTPVISTWVIAAVRDNERMPLGKVQAKSSAEALALACAVAVASDRRLIATTEAVAKRILGISASTLDALVTLA
jgi:hypothetical protein